MKDNADKNKVQTDMVHKALLNEDKQVDDNTETAEMMIDNASDSLKKALAESRSGISINSDSTKKPAVG